MQATLKEKIQTLFSRMQPTAVKLLDKDATIESSFKNSLSTMD